MIRTETQCAGRHMRISDTGEDIVPVLILIYSLRQPLSKMKTNKQKVSNCFPLCINVGPLIHLPSGLDLSEPRLYKPCKMPVSGSEVLPRISYKMGRADPS